MTSTRVRWALVVAAASVAVAVAMTRRDLPPTFRAAACAASGLDGATRCGTVDVLESPEQADGRRLTLDVVVLTATTATPASDPVLFLAGGPGQGAAQLAAVLSPRLAFLRHTRDLVFVDQRGTGGTHRLECVTPRTASELMGRIFDPVTLASCRDQLARRADLRRYTTSDAAADYDAIFTALGYEHVNVWGVSYGSRLGLELARRFPRRVRTLTIEAAVPTSFAWPTTGARDLDAAIGAVVADCEVDTSCASSFPNLRADVDRAFSGVRATSRSVQVFDPYSRTTERVPFGASDLAYAVRGVLYGPEALTLPALFTAAAAGRYDGFAQAYVNRARALGRELATGVHLGVYCAEDLPLVDAARVRRAAAGTRIGTYLLDQYIRACDTWPQTAVPQGFSDAVRSDVPTLIMTGRRDPVTPPWTAHAIAKTLARARVITWRSGGHGFDGLTTPACKESIISDFVNTARVDTLSVECVSRDRARAFVTR